MPLLMDATPRFETVTVGEALLNIPTTPEVRPAGRDAATPRGTVLDGRFPPIVLDGRTDPVVLEPVLVPPTVTMPVGETDTVGSAAMAAFVAASARASVVNWRFSALMDLPPRISWTHCVT